MNADAQRQRQRDLLRLVETSSPIERVRDIDSRNQTRTMMTTTIEEAPDEQTDAPRPGADRLVPLVSWTFAIAVWRKGLLKGPARTKVIVQMNRIYLAISVALFVLMILLSSNTLVATQWSRTYPTALVGIPTFLVTSYCMSRCIEVAYAFYRDAFAKLGRVPSDSDLDGRQRIGLALASYIELIIDFAILYALVPNEAWHHNGNAPRAVTDLLFYSASTITTSGGGGFVPKDAVLQIFTAVEIACGLILLVVCFAVYSGDAFAQPCRATPAKDAVEQQDTPLSRD